MKIKRIVAALIAIVLLGLGAATAAPAETYYEAQVKKFESLKTKTLDLDLSFCGMYVAKSAKFYGRKVTGVAPDGTFILGNWEVLYQDTSIPMSFLKKKYTGAYVQFAYSMDVAWGTDWPYSGIFWTDVDTPIYSIEIINQGFCRNVDIAIYADDKFGFRDCNCSSHKEWKP